MADLVKVENLSVSYKIGGGLFSQNYLKAVNNVSLTIKRGSFFGLVGESGSGKTTLGRALLNAAPISSGSAHYDDGDVSYELSKLDKTQLADYRKRAQLIFQDPYAALSPRMTVRDIIAEPIEVMKLASDREEIDSRVRTIASRCRLNLEAFKKVPACFFRWPKTTYFNC